MHPGPRGFLTVVWRGSSIEIGEVPRLEAPEAPAALAARIADAVAPRLSGAARVHVHAHRSLASAPLDRSLAARLQVPVAFAVDAPPRAPGAACTGALRALLVTNPRSDLWGASTAAPSVRADLARMGFTVDTLEGAAATRAAILPRLADPCTALLHYDGHGLAPAGRAAPGDPGVGAATIAPTTRCSSPKATSSRRPACSGSPAYLRPWCSTAAPPPRPRASASRTPSSSRAPCKSSRRRSTTSAAAGADSRRLFERAPPSAGFTTRLFERASPALGLDLVSLFARTVATGGEVTALRVFER